MSDYLQLIGKRFRVSKHVDAVLSFAVFLVSLAFYTWHWLIAQRAINHDATRLALYAVDLLEEGVFSLYVYHQYSPNPFIIYVESLVFAVFGYSDISVQSVTVVGGALTAPAVYWASRWLFEDLGIVFARRAGLIAALGLALSVIFSSLSRSGLENILLPAVEAAAVAFLWRGLRRGSKLDFVLSGLLVGVSQYVYIVARFFPVGLAVASAGAVLANRQLLTQWRGLIWAAVASALVALPQWIQYVTFPYTFYARVTNPAEPSGGQFVFELADPVAVIAAKFLDQMAALGWRVGDVSSPLEFRPILTPVLAVCFVVGLAVVICRRRDGHVFGLLLMALMFLPDLLTYEKYDPSGMDITRFIAGIPFIFIVAGLGSASIWAWIEGRRRIPHWMGPLILVLLLLSGLLRQWDFVERIRPYHLTLGRHSLDFTYVAEYIGNHLDTPILMPTYQYQYLFKPHAFLLAKHFSRRRAGWEASLRPGERVNVIQLDLDNKHPDDWVLLEDGTVYFLPPMPEIVEPLNGERTVILNNKGDMVAEAFEGRWQGERTEYLPMDAAFENHLNLVGYQSSSFEPGSPYKATFFWKPTQRIKRDVELIVQLYDPLRARFVVDDLVWPLNGVFRVRAWQPDQIMPLSHSLQIPENLPPGPYQLSVGVSDLIARERIPLATGQDMHLVETIKVFLPQDDRVPETFTAINFGDLIELRGYTLTPIQEGLKVTLFWRAMESPEDDYTSFVHIVDADDQIVAQADMQPLDGRYPTSVWSPDELIVEERTVSPIPEGEYRIFIGWYLHQEGGWERLTTVTEGSSPAADRVLLDTVTIQ